MLWHLLRHGRRYDVVHTASFPYFSLLAAAVAAAGSHGFRLVVDWFELWSRDYWREYLGGVGGRIGRAVQALCLRVPPARVLLRRLTAGRLRAEGVRGDVTVLRGQYAGPLTPPAPLPAEPLVVFAGRHIPEKRAPAVVPAVALRARAHARAARAHLRRRPGPRRGARRDRRARRSRTSSRRRASSPTEEVEHDLARALCLVLPSRREGYGLVVVEASAVGTPSVLVRDPDNAATELVEEGVNGFVAPTRRPSDARRRDRARARGGRERCARRPRTGSRANAQRLSLDSSLDAVAASYARSARS